MDNINRMHSLRLKRSEIKGKSHNHGKIPLDLKTVSIINGGRPQPLQVKIRNSPASAPPGISTLVKQTRYGRHRWPELLLKTKTLKGSTR